MEFAERAFADVHVRTIFLSELERCTETLRFLRDELPEELERLRNADPDRRAAALRAALCAES